MPRAKKIENSSEACLAIEFSLTTLQTFYELKPGSVLCLTGKSHNESNSASLHFEDITVEVEKREQSLCLLLFATAMGSVFKRKLTKRWNCQLSSANIANEPHIVKDSKRKSNQIQSHETRDRNQDNKVKAEQCVIKKEMVRSCLKDMPSGDMPNISDSWNTDRPEESTCDEKHESDLDMNRELGNSSSTDELSHLTDQWKRVGDDEHSLADRECNKCEKLQDESVGTQNKMTDDARGTSSADLQLVECSTDLTNYIPLMNEIVEGDEENGVVDETVLHSNFMESSLGTSIKVRSDGSCVQDREKWLTEEGDQTYPGDQNSEDEGEKHELSDGKDGSESDGAKTTQYPTGFQCIFCGKDYGHETNPQLALDKHLLRKCTRNPWSRDSVEPEPTVSEKFPLKCVYCPKAFDTSRRLQSHQQKCARNPQYMAKFDKESLKLKICDICDRLFANEKALVSHKVMVHGYARVKDIPVNYPCRHCQMPFNCRGTRYHHETYKCSMNPNVAQLTYCRICDKKMAKEKLDEHMKESHATMEHCVCDVCGAVFPSSRRLYTHMYTHKVKVPKHKCPTCGRMFKLKNQMERHLTTHTDERNVQCPVCGKCFKNKDQERDHRLAVHEGRYKYRCDKCGHGVAKKIYLDNHRCGRVRRVQDGEKPVKLSETKKPGRRFRNNSSSGQRGMLNNDHAMKMSYFMMPEVLCQNVPQATQEQQMAQQPTFVPSQYNSFSPQSVQPAVQAIQPSAQSAQPAVQMAQPPVPSLLQSSLQHLVQPDLHSSLEGCLESSVTSGQSSLYLTAQAKLQTAAHLNPPLTLQSSMQSSLQSSVPQMWDSAVQSSL